MTSVYAYGRLFDRSRILENFKIMSITLQLVMELYLSKYVMCEE